MTTHSRRIRAVYLAALSLSFVCAVASWAGDGTERVKVARVPGGAKVVFK